MKRTDRERMERELRRLEKKERIAEKRSATESSVAGFAKALTGSFLYDDLHILNLEDDEILELLMEMKESLPEKQWDAALKKAVRMTKVEERQDALTQLRALLESA